MTPHERSRRLWLRRIRITGWTALSSLLVTLVGFLTFFHIVFPADREATLEVYRDDRVQVSTSPGAVIMSPTGDATGQGILYFPGARVDPYSYLYPFADVVAEGTTLVIVDPLFNMALLDSRGVEELSSALPGITSWTIAGHSLGGVKACLEADHPLVRSVVLFASYCATDIRARDIQVTQVTGARDGLIDEQQRADAERFLPSGSPPPVIIEGANHASFGTYGPQPGDGVAALSHSEFRVILTDIMRDHLSAD
jgi:hypothetical protein